VTEILDGEALGACEAHVRSGLPRDVGAVLMLEIDGYDDDVLAAESEMIVRHAEMYGPTDRHEVSEGAEMDRIWQTCEAVHAALGRHGRVHCVDVAVPAARLGDAISQIGDIAARYNLRGANLCRVADGIVRSVFLSDAEEDGERAQAAIGDVAEMTVRLGGVVSGEYGVGLSKRDVFGFQHPESDLKLQRRLKTNFDTEWLLNHGKMFPLVEETQQVADGLNTN
jgi:glycolate oxidase